MTEVEAGENPVGIYDHKPEPFLERIFSVNDHNPALDICCAGFELGHWRCVPFAGHLVEWLPEYALPENELHVTHANIYVKLKQAAIRVYTSGNYQKRGEVGEIALHAICRQFFDTVPISPRVFYKSASNDVIKSFDLVHARFPSTGGFEIWLGESKLYDDSGDGIADAIRSVRLHIEQGFLENQKILLGPQIPKSTPHYDKILKIFATQSSIDAFLKASVFVIGIMANSPTAKSASTWNEEYKQSVRNELTALAGKLAKSGLSSQLRLYLIYVPLGDKEKLVEAFDGKLKALQ